MPWPVAIPVMQALMVEYFANGWVSPAEVMGVIDKMVQDHAEQFANPDQWGESPEAVAAAATKMAATGGPAPMRRPG